MPKPALRSRKYRKIRKKVPGGRLAYKYVKKRQAENQCSKCGGILHGTSRERQFKSVSKTARRPNRPYGGNLCSACTRLMVKSKIIKA